MTDRLPAFPPLLNGWGLSADKDPVDWAYEGVAKENLGAGDLVWSEDVAHLRFALVLEPDVPRARCGEIIYTAMVAFGDAAGALIPPEVAITYQWPNVIQMNDGQVGFVDLIVSDEENDDIPAWMVLGLEVQLMPLNSELNPGENYHVTTFWDEGCGEISRTELLESVSRHMVNAIHTLTEDGFKPIHEQWCARLNGDAKLSRHLPVKEGRFIGVDETGTGLLSINGETVSRSLFEVLADLRGKRGGAE